MGNVAWNHLVPAIREGSDTDLFDRGLGQNFALTTIAYCRGATSTAGTTATITSALCAAAIGHAARTLDTLSGATATCSTCFGNVLAAFAGAAGIHRALAEIVTRLGASDATAFQALLVFGAGIAICA